MKMKAQHDLWGVLWGDKQRNFFWIWWLITEPKQWIHFPNLTNTEGGYCNVGGMHHTFPDSTRNADWNYWKEEFQCGAVLMNTLPQSNRWIEHTCQIPFGSLVAGRLAQIPFYFIYRRSTGHKFNDKKPEGGERGWWRLACLACSTWKSSTKYTPRDSLSAPPQRALAAFTPRWG